MTLSPIQLRRDISVNWTTLNPVLRAGEPVITLDTGELRIGDGGTAYLDLPVYATIESIADYQETVDQLKAELALANEQVADSMQFIINALEAADAEFEGILSGAQQARTDAQTAATDAANSANISLAGQFLGQALGAANNLDGLTAPGIYRNPNGGYATLANNYPVAGMAGVLTVTQWANPGFVIQRYTPYPTVGSAPQAVAGEWIRAYRGISFGPWRFMATQRVDQTAGRAIYTWDDVNNREQLIYGDTGWRDISSTLLNGWTTYGGVHIRRFGATVFLRIYGLVPDTATGPQFIDMPIGFTPSFPGNAQLMIAGGNGSQQWSIEWLGTSSQLQTSRLNGRVAPNAWSQVEWSTAASWPTTLSGTAVGGIPNV